VKSTITVEVQYIVQPATGPNLKGQPLELIEADGTRYSYEDSEESAAKTVHDIFDEAGMLEAVIDIDGRVQ